MARTSIEWSYAPPDLLEAPLTLTTDSATISFADGKVTAVLHKATDPVPDHLLQELRAVASKALLASQVLTRRSLELKPGHVVHQIE